jgi:hypothetical protein
VALSGTARVGVHRIGTIPPQHCPAALTALAHARALLGDMDHARDAESLGRRLHALLLEALKPPGRPARIDLRVAAPERALVLRCDATPARRSRPAAGPLRVIAPRPRRDALADFIEALAQGRARGIVFRAFETPRAVFRGSIAGCSVRLAVAECGGGGLPVEAPAGRR